MSQSAPVLSEWKRYEFSELVTIGNDMIDPREDQFADVVHVGPENIVGDSGRIINLRTVGELGLISGKYTFDSEAIVYSKIRPNLNKVCAPNFSGVCSADTYPIWPDKRLVRRDYLLQLMMSSDFLRQTIEVSLRTGMPKINRQDLSKVTVQLPPLPEQRQIAAILSTWDCAIELTDKQIAAKQQRKAALMQKLLAGSVRFGTSDPEHRNVTVGEVVEKVATAIDVEAAATYREIGIRSHGKGIFHKEPVLGSAIGEKRVYKVEPACLTFNIVFAWEQAIAVTTANEAGFICSHRFPMFRPKVHIAEPQYLLAYFLSPKGTEMLELASPGGAGRNRTLGQSAFLKLKVPLPNMAFQQRFVSLADTLDAELSLQAGKLDALRRQKKGLMQQLLTGKVRVKVTEPSGA